MRYVIKRGRIRRRQLDRWVESENELIAFTIKRCKTWPILIRNLWCIDGFEHFFLCCRAGAYCSPTSPYVSSINFFIAFVIWQHCLLVLPVSATSRWVKNHRQLTWTHIAALFSKSKIHSSNRSHYFDRPKTKSDIPFLNKTAAFDGRRAASASRKLWIHINQMDDGGIIYYNTLIKIRRDNVCVWVWLDGWVSSQKWKAQCEAT